jgi:hypothetical protein
MQGRRVMGRYPVTCSGGFPGLGIGTTIPCFHASGTSPEAQLALNRESSSSLHLSDAFDRKMFIIASWPGAVFFNALITRENYPAVEGTQLYFLILDIPLTTSEIATAGD